jgi:adenine/guanine phosphoribosyltransferase-like PRPP-binding protein
VPSSRGREGTHPLETVVRIARSQRPLYERLLDATGAGLDHRDANEQGYRVRADVDGKRVLLVDDVFTTGARVQSAASALARAGADVIACIALGPIVRPAFSDEAQELWDRQREIPFDFNVCCLED